MKEGAPLSRPESPKAEMSAAEVQRLLKNNFKPDIYVIMRNLATGKFKRMGNKNGFPYKHHDSSALKAKRLRQIEKGMIQVTPEPNKPTQEVSNAG